ncbi:MAG: protein kinase [Chitinivibrionales bacterium]|nr:protein kinase [Chitinivibrionales bacterium]MBD3356694.1 protein kinase [Chitinivibrionales bacterium]
MAVKKKNASSPSTGSKVAHEDTSAENTNHSPVGKDPFIGRTVGACRILEKINEGGTAYIYRARNETFHLDRVIKILKPSLMNEEDFYDRFAREAQLTARLDHPNILRVFDTGEVDGYFYIEMEHVAGQSLRTYLGNNPRISEKQILNISSQVAKALEYAHNVKITAPDGNVINGILHRDIKPENIMVTPEDVVKLMDFGAAKPLNITSDTMQGMIVGTFHYMSPEQIEGKDLDARSDFFSLGIVMYELFTGRKPFNGKNLTMLIQSIRKCEHTSPRKLRPSISPLTEELIEKLLSRNPNHRPSRAREIDESLQICLQAYAAWGSGRKVRVPFSIKRAYPAISMVFSIAALVISFMSFAWNGGLIRMPMIDGGSGKLRKPVKGEAETYESLLEKGRKIEELKQWKEAVTIYELVPSVSEGGVANEYLEAQVRLARISFRHLNQFTRARAILERLGMEYSDPVIDAYLGEIYFRLALYGEARDRLDAALNTSKGSVIPNGPDSKKDLLYYYAYSLDKQYIYVDRDPGTLREAIEAWNYYMVSARCEEEDDHECPFARKRLAELESINDKLLTDG